MMKVYAVCLGVLVIFLGCGTTDPNAVRVSASESDGVTVTRGDLKLAIDPQGRPTIEFQGKTLVDPPSEGSEPLNFLEIEGQRVSNFALDPQSVSTSPVNGDHGSGSRVHFTLSAPLNSGGSVQQIVDLDLYDRYPALAVLGVSYQGVGINHPLTVTRTWTGYLRLNSSISFPENPAYGFHTFQGGSYEWGHSYAGVPITADFKQKNFMGLYRRSEDDPEGEGGGINLIDIWNQVSGIALSHLASRDLFISFPTETDPSGLVRISVMEEPDRTLGDQVTIAPGEVYRVRAPIGIIFHDGDYFAPLRTYRDLVIDEGVDVQEDSPAWAYQSYWKTWGWQRKFTMQMVYDRIPQLLELGIRQLQIDDGWQDYVGDWNPNREKYPRGEADVIASIKEMRRLGIERVYLWWNPLGVDPDSEMARKTEWLVLGEDGKPATTRQHTLCPAYPPVQEHIRQLVRKWISEWGYDGLYNDFAMNSVAPACFNPAHHHEKPTDAFAATPVIWKIIWDELHKLHPDPFAETCICSLPHSLFKGPYMNMTSASDPLTNFQVRTRIKVEKATHGPRWAYTNCYIEEGRRDPLPQFSDADFASSVGIGSILTTLYAELTPEMFRQYKKWFDIYHREMISTGDYLNLYDISYDLPESHAIRKGEVMYYGFYSDEWTGPIELRGLEDRSYQVIDYVEGKPLAKVHGPVGKLDARFENYLLVKCTPIP